MSDRFSPLGLREAARLLAAEESSGADAIFTTVDTDSRRLPAGALFVALSGPNFDGHDFVAAARRRGAQAALVSRWVADPLPQLRVTDTRLALGRLAASWRARFTGPLIALTGSNGKTTLKEMLAAILRRRGSTLATEG
ncbi:MAG: UDP-N-acetylmuramoyl-tripeptide--D-alanyl-D-alanine ligase, partial [Candidatus Competibacteraceae bacterium]|nr:UDP-N-acetylmuramoyl-tripeptide--D-alanyl-D-alanine ligase [Candidatus Competibacteraceae bacterium]